MRARLAQSMWFMAPPLRALRGGLAEPPGSPCASGHRIRTVPRGDPGQGRRCPGSPAGGPRGAAAARADARDAGGGRAAPTQSRSRCAPRGYCETSRSPSIRLNRLRARPPLTMATRRRCRSARCPGNADGAFVFSVSKHVFQEVEELYRGSCLRCFLSSENKIA